MLSVWLTGLLSFTLTVCGQSDGDLRLVGLFGDTDVSTGRLELYLSGQWGTACSLYFSSINAGVTCRQLGYSGSSSYRTADSLGFPEGTGPIWVVNRDCTGTESRLIDCERDGFGLQNCDHSRDVAVTCTDGNSRDEAAGIRLVATNGLSGGMAGRVEVFRFGQWLTLQDPRPFLSSPLREDRRATLICRQLGFNSHVHYDLAFDLGRFVGDGSLQSLPLPSCSNAATRLDDCSFASSPSRPISVFSPFAVSCAGTYNPLSPLSGDIRLNTESTSRPFSGRLEVYYAGQWGTVCSDGFGQTEADLACRQLGLMGALYYGNVGEIGFSQGSGSIWLDDLNCSSSNTIAQCRAATRIIGSHNCVHNQDVALVCFGEGSLRITSDSSGSSSATLTSGRLEIFAGSGRFGGPAWGTVCSDDFGQAEADLACRGIGQARATGFSNVDTSSNFDTSLPILLDDVSCTGPETNLLLCSHRGISSNDCDHSDDIRISCTDLSAGGAAAIGVTVVLMVIVTIIVIICCVSCCIYSKWKKNTTSPALVTRLQPQFETQGRSYAFNLEPVEPTAPIVESDHSTAVTQQGPPYPSSGQYTSAYPSAYPSAPPQQLPTAAYPIGQALPAPYSSGPQAPPAPHPSTQVQSGEEKKPELYPDAPPAYGEVVNYPGQYKGVSTTSSQLPVGSDFQQQQSPPQYCQL